MGSADKEQDGVGEEEDSRPFQGVRREPLGKQVIGTDRNITGKERASDVLLGQSVGEKRLEGERIYRGTQRE